MKTTKAKKIEEVQIGHCPFCNCSFTEKELIVEMKRIYKFDEKGQLFTRQTTVDKIICSNCLNDITMSYIGLLYEQTNN